MTKIGLKEPFELKKRPHPALKDIPPLDPKGPEMDAIRAAIMQTGQIVEPVLLDSEGRIATDHGRMLVQAACDLGIEQIAYQETEFDGPTLIANELLVRRHYTKGAVAFLLYPHLESAWKASKARRVANLKQWTKTPINSDSALSAQSGKVEAPVCHTMDDFALEIGISRRLLMQASEVHAYFEKHEGKKFKFKIKGGPQDGGIVEATLREYFTPRIVGQPTGGEHGEDSGSVIGLGACIAGMAAKVDGKDYLGEERPVYTYATSEFWSRRIAALMDGADDWHKTPEEIKIKALAILRANLKRMPEEWVDLMLSEAEKRAKR